MIIPLVSYKDKILIKMKLSGTVFLHLLGGSILSCVISIKVSSNAYNLGMIIPYFASYFYQGDHSVNSSLFTIIFGVTGISETLVNFMVSHLLKYLSPKNMILIFGSISCFALFLTSYIQSALLFCWLYGIALGLLVGILFLPTLYSLWSTYPESKGFILGWVLAFFNFGIIPFGYLFTITANPLDLAGIKTSPNSEEVIFDERVASRVPWMIQLSSLSFLAAVLLGLVLLPSKIMMSEKEEVICLDYKKILTNFRFWNLFWMMTFGLSANMYIRNLYKVIGLISSGSDHLNSYIGMGLCISNGFTNVYFAYILNKYDWKKIMIGNYLILMVLNGSLWYVVENVYLYAIWVSLSGLFGGSISVSVILLTENDFPKDHRVLSCVSISLILVYFVPYILETFITPVFGYFFTFMLICFMYLITIFQVIIHPKKLNNDIEDSLLVSS